MAKEATSGTEQRAIRRDDFLIDVEIRDDEGNILDHTEVQLKQ